MNVSRVSECNGGTGIPPVSSPAGRRCHRWVGVGGLRVSPAKRVIVCLATVVVVITTGCDTAADNGAFAVVETSVSFIRDFVLNVIAAVLL